MIAWLQANIGTVLICAALVAVVTLIIVGMVRDHRKGKSSCGGCGGGCAGCALSGSCHGGDLHPKDGKQKP